MSNTSQFEVLAPLYARDFRPNNEDIAGHIKDIVHRTYAEIEAAALPVPEGATYESERAALVGALSFGRASFEGITDCRATVGSELLLPFIDGWQPQEDKPDEEEPMIRVASSVALRSYQKFTPDQRCAMQAVRWIHAADSAPAIKEKKLLEVAGTSQGFFYNRTYTYDTPEQQTELRSRLGALIAADPAAEIEALVAVSMTRSYFIMRGGIEALAINARPRRVPRGENTLPTSPSAAMPRMRVVRALLERGAWVERQPLVL